MFGMAVRTISAFFFFFFNDTATTEIYTLSLHDALPIWRALARLPRTCGGHLRAPAPWRSRLRRPGISSPHAVAIHLPGHASAPRLPKAGAVPRRRPAPAPPRPVATFPARRGALLRQRADELQRRRGAHLPWPACVSILLRRARVPARRSGGDSPPRRVPGLRRRFVASPAPHAAANSRLPPGCDAHVRRATHSQPAAGPTQTAPGGVALRPSSGSARA